MRTRGGAAALIALFVLGFFALRGDALDNGLGRRPAMGYNSWYDLECGAEMNEQTIRKTADAFVKYGLDKLGYTYVNLDDCWAAGRDSSGKVYPDPKAFPSGIGSLASYIHSHGLKFGIYTDRGTNTCAGRPGSSGYEKIDAQTYASWGVDFLKEDSCYATQDHETAFKEYGTMRDALNSTRRPIYFDVCGWNDWYAPVGATLGNEWRIGGDDTVWTGVLSNINIDANLAQYAGPGGWNNPCLLLGARSNGTLRITELQTRAQFSMWAVLAAPLMLSLNVRPLSQYTLATLTNTEVIAVNQDDLGKQGERIFGGALDPDSSNVANLTNVWARPLKDGSRAVVFINVGPRAASITCDKNCFSRMGFHSPTAPLSIRDLWTHSQVGTITAAAGFTALRLPAEGGVMMVKISQ